MGRRRGRGGRGHGGWRRRMRGRPQWCGDKEGDKVRWKMEYKYVEVGEGEKGEVGIGRIR